MTSDAVTAPPAGAPRPAVTDHTGPLLRCERLVVGYDGRALLPPIDLTLQHGEFLAVVGRNGSGKSTWFKTLLGLHAPVSGRIWRCQSVLRVAYVPQSTALDPIVPVQPRDVVMWGRLHGWSFLRALPSARDLDVRDDALERAGAASLARIPYRHLSDGQRQRVLLARMLATEAELVVLDEPTAAMDVIAEREAMAHLARLARAARVAVIVISHHLGVARDHADRVLFVDRDEHAPPGEGTVRVGTPDEIFADAPFTRRYGATGAAHDF